MAEDRSNAYSRILEYEQAMARRQGRDRMARYYNNREYYDGNNMPPGGTDMPLGANYVQILSQNHNSYLWGQFDEGADIIGYTFEPIGEATDELRKLGKRIERHVYRLHRDNNANALFYQEGLNASSLGDAVLRPTWDDEEQRVRWEGIQAEYVHFRWEPTDIRKIKEVILAYPISRSDAQEMYGTAGDPAWTMGVTATPALLGFAMYWERWDKLEREVWVDNTKITDRSGNNPYVGVKLGSDGKPLVLPSVIPYIHVPNLQAGGEFYGYSDIEPAFMLQDEINRRLADQGDIISNFAHPITIVRKYYDPTSDLINAPDQIWDMGREGEAELLQWKGTPPGVDEYIERLLQVMFDTTAMSKVCFGRSEGTQQSAISLAVKMLPVTERAKWKRMLWAIAIRQLVRYSIFIEERMGVDLGFKYEDLFKFDLKLQWAPMLPKDRLEMVQEIIQRVVNHTISVEKALTALGELEPDVEWERIKKNLEELAKLGALQAQAQQAAVGSSKTPGGLSKSTAKGRPVGSTKSD